VALIQHFIFGIGQGLNLYEYNSSSCSYLEVDTNLLLH